MTVVGAKLRKGVPTSKLRSVELIRFLAAFSVILWHYQFYFFATEAASGSVDRGFLPLSGILSIFYNSGHYAVEWFWVLSGYIFFFNYRDALANQKITGFEFFFRRFARLYPLHFATLLVVSLLLLSYRYLFKNNYPLYTEGANVGTFISQLFMASNWTTTQYTFNGPIWSVSVEVLIYILFFFLTKYAKIRGLPKTLFVAVTCMILYYVATRKDFGFGATSWIAECATCFYLGGVVHEIRGRYKLDPTEGLWQAAFWVGLAAAVFAFYQFRPTYVLAFFVPASAILFIVCSGAIETSKIVASLARLGNWTYSSYLLHFPIALLIVIGMQLAALNTSAIAKQPMFLVAYIVLVFALSDVCYIFFEAPTRRALRMAVASK
jgi:peptidoglycan/LPS O-acetylase OafA/YrhL